MAILDAYGKPFVMPRSKRAIKARYDSAQTNAGNERHWSNADALSADAAASSGVRTTIRNRARYEYANNGYARAMVRALANAVIGTGPRLQVYTPNEDANAFIEAAWARWSQACTLPQKLLEMRQARCVDGECLGLVVQDEAITRTQDISLSIRVLECDRLASPWESWDDPGTDGIGIDSLGRPTKYYLYDEHPGNTRYRIGLGGRWYPADSVIHSYRRDRPEQHRGVSELSPALPLFAQLRRYTLAVLTAAETAADIAAVLESQRPDSDATGYEANGTSTSAQRSYEAFDSFDIDRGMITTLPEGVKLSQLKAEQPTTTYAAFKREVLAEAFAAVLLPYGIGAMDSKDYNFASGKLDRNTFNEAVQIERETEWNPILCRIMLHFLDELLLQHDFRFRLPPVSEWSWEWQWDAPEDLDPEKAANSRMTALQSFQTTIPAVFAAKGKDWRTAMEAQAEALGITVDELQQDIRETLYGTSRTRETKQHSA